MAQSITDDTSVDMKALEETIRHNLGSGSLLSVRSCIFRVPEVLRRNSTKAFQPDVLAIRPLHDRKQSQYQQMENAKRWYLREYILSSKNVKLAKLIEGVTSHEKLARSWYAESLDSIKSKEFIEMMILDGCFIAELFRKFTYKKRKRTDGSQPKPDDPILTMDCMILYICHDILLLENQLPWFVLQSLYDLTQGNLDHGDLSLSELILEVFSFLPSVGNNFKAYRSYLNDNCHGKDDEATDHKHILDLIRTSIVYSLKRPVSSHDDETRCFSRPKKHKKDFGKGIPPAITLSKGGVRFKSGFHDGGKSIMSMGFEDGVFSIPELVIGHLTESLFRNLIALEQCCQSVSHLVTSYAAVMEQLILSKEDMEFLCDREIIRSFQSAEDVSPFVKICSSNDTMIEDYYFEELCTGVNNYYNLKCVRWKENFKREYFHTPWTIISLFAATILLVLTLIQTIFTVKQ